MGDHMQIAVLGLGEAGRIFAESFAQAGQQVVGFDPAPVVVDEAVTRVDSVAEAVAGADLILSLTTARFALGAAQDAATHLKEGAFYLDLNAGSAALKQEIQAAVEALNPAAIVVDGAVIGSVRSYGAQVQVLLAGEHAETAAQQLLAAGGNPEVVSTSMGAASQRKLLRSVFMKGLGALITESMEAGELAGETEWMQQQIARALADGDAGVERLHSGTKIHGARRAHELGDSMTMLAALGRTDWPVTKGAYDQHLKASRENSENLIEELAQVPTAAIGDGGDRLGFLNSTVKPIWGRPRVAGRALTVLTRAGDNAPVHEAIKIARPGDILVVAGGEYTDRALMGILIANRLRNKGVTAFITDGAVRDLSELEEAQFPVWAAGLSPAGPYKSGPGRVNVPVAIAGAVCMPGDYIVADEDGVIVVPANEARRALAGARAVLEDEAQRMKNILAEREAGAI